MRCRVSARYRVQLDAEHPFNCFHGGKFTVRFDIAPCYPSNGQLQSSHDSFQAPEG